MTPKLKLAELTSQEAREELTKDAVILLPMGSLEDQGTHAPMGDYMGAEAVALDIARKAREYGVPTFMAPVIPFGGKDYFESSHGGISLRHATLVAVIEDMVSCLKRHGLTKILVINGHGGNVPAIMEVALRRRREEGIILCSMYLWQISYEILKEMFGPEGAAKRSGHGSDPLTSIGLHYYPEVLRPDLKRQAAKAPTSLGLPVGGFDTVSYQGVKFQAPVEAIETAPDGVWGGDPVHSDAETGAKLAARLAEIGAGFIRDHVARSFPG